jgi:hypothetical protein
MNHNNRSQRGLTLIEMLVIAPFVMLFIGALIFLLVQLSGNSLASKEQATTAYNTQDALDNMEQDVYYATAFPSSVKPLNSPQGSDNSTTAAFTNLINFTATPPPSPLTEANALIFKVPAISASPFTPSRQLIYAKAPAPTNCSTPAENTNDIFPVYYVYFINGSTLYRRTILGDSTDSVQCANDPTPWQVGSCFPGHASSSVCTANDEALLTNVTSNGLSVTTVNNSSISVTLTTSTIVAGKNVNYSATRYMTSSNLQ